MATLKQELKMALTQRAEKLKMENEASDRGALAALQSIWPIGSIARLISIGRFVTIVPDWPARLANSIGQLDWPGPQLKSANL